MIQRRVEHTGAQPACLLRPLIAIRPPKRLFIDCALAAAIVSTVLRRSAARPQGWRGGVGKLTYEMPTLELDGACSERERPRTVRDPLPAGGIALRSRHDHVPPRAEAVACIHAVVLPGAVGCEGACRTSRRNRACSRPVGRPDGLRYPQKLPLVTDPVTVRLAGASMFTSASHRPAVSDTSDPKHGRR